MKTTNLEFDGTTYLCRVVNSNDGEELIIAPTSLLDALRLRPYGTEYDGFASEEAVPLDEKFFFYINDADLQLPDDELVVELKESNADYCLIFEISLVYTFSATPSVISSY